MPTTNRCAEPWRASRIRPAVAGAIVLLHLLLAIVLVMRPAPRSRDLAREDRWTTVRLIPPVIVAATPEPPPAPSQRQKEDRPPRHATPRPIPITLPVQSTPAEAPPPAVQNSISATAAEAAPAPAASAPPVPAIVIPSQGLARGTSRHPALDDPRANRAVESPGDRFARGIGADDRLVEEWRGEGRHRVRQGTSCVDVKVARDAQLDPYNQNYRPAPRLVEPCR